ncbi:MAG: imidazole glycerol phosphate synthase subunit HisH [Ardenticatenaceae bacterium]|nr:imidazole glycerol phosphate synthase subunit HisH [Ardenticatenaceae bacterium]
MTKITMIDYGGSNLRSAQKAFEVVGADLWTTADPDIIRRADKLVLPGVGAFGAGMDAVRGLGLVEPIREAVQHGIPMLGICIGMQFLFDESEEMGCHKGLGLIPGQVVHFKTSLQSPVPSPQSPVPNLKVPHMGWNQLEHDGSHFLLQGVEPGAYTYFVHSYHCVPADEDWIVARTEYGRPFCAIVARENVYGIQFHPEKSHQVGLRIIQNFVEAVL